MLPVIPAPLRVELGIDRDRALGRLGWTERKIRQQQVSWDRTWVRRVAEAREAGASWAQIGQALGVSKQAARARFLRAQP